MKHKGVVELAKYWAKTGDQRPLTAAYPPNVHDSDLAATALIRLIGASTQTEPLVHGVPVHWLR